jgi:L-lactate dehydrogenase complex protein LldG
MTEREKILGRIHEALNIGAPFPGMAHNGKPELAAAPSAADFRAVLPPSGKAFAERLDQFRKNAADLKAELHLVRNIHEITALLRDLKANEKWTKIAAHKGEWISDIANALELPILYTDSPYAVRDLESCSAGLSLCDALIAQTGSVLVTERSAGGRALSVLPPHHVVLASASQLLADLPEAFALLKQKYAPAYPSFISLITGPSRTGDIERILVLGAHGPKKLTIILLQEA